LHEVATAWDLAEKFVHPPTRSERILSVEQVELTSSSTPIDELAARLLSGDERALDECYRRHGPMVRAYVGRFVPRDDCEDIVQQTFFELWRSRARLDPTRSVIAFVLGIARNRSIDQLRRRKNVVVDVNQLRDLVGDDGDAFVDRLAWSSDVRRGLDSLVADQREALELAYFGDLTQREIADRLGVPIGTVKARMARGMHRLSERIEKGELR
jgi:RNA polymerase sigma-70 factor (ECF subfamily)